MSPRLGGDRERQRVAARLAPQIDEEACRQRIEHREGRKPGGIQEAGDEVVADIRDVEGATRPVEETRSVEPGPELDRTPILARDARREALDHPRKARP